MRPIETAPKSGEDILVLGPYGWRRAFYVDCAWLRETDPTIADAWRTYGFGDIELDEARAWKPASKRK